MAEEVKKWYESKTMWVNGLMIVAGLCTALADHLVAGGALTLLSVVNIVLRAVTKAKIQ